MVETTHTLSSTVESWEKFVKEFILYQQCLTHTHTHTHTHTGECGEKSNIRSWDSDIHRGG